MVNRTRFIGTDDQHVYALDAGVDGPSQDTRVQLGTRGHYTTNVDDSSLPGFGTVAALAGLGGAGYLIKRRI